LPDRGYNVAARTDYRTRFYKISITFKPVTDPAALPEKDRQRSVVATVADTILLTDADGQSTTGLDPAEGGVRPAAKGFPRSAAGQDRAASPSMLRRSCACRTAPSSSATSTGPTSTASPAEGGCCRRSGRPTAFIPMRNGKQNFSSNNPGPGAQAPNPKDPDTGRQNNQGFEGMARNARRQVPGW